MILDSRKKEHIPLMSRYKKVKGIMNIFKYLPDLNPNDKLYVIESEQDWEKIKYEFPVDKVTARCDSLIGVNGKLPDGQTFSRDNVKGYIQIVKSAVPDGVVILQQMKPGYSERLHTQGGVNIDSEIGEYIRLEYVGPSFDCRELCKGKAVHESWYIPWEEVPFLREPSMGKYRVGGLIPQDAYLATRDERCTFLLGTFAKEYLKKHYNLDNVSQSDIKQLLQSGRQDFIEAYAAKKQEILGVMPESYNGIRRQILRDVISQVIFPLYDQRLSLYSNGLRHFGVELNVIENGTLVPLELSTGERFIQKGKDNKVSTEQLTRDD